MLAYNLNQQINGEKLLKDISSLISKYSNSTDSLILYIDIRKVCVEYNCTTYLIEDKQKTPPENDGVSCSL